MVDEKKTTRKREMIFLPTTAEKASHVYSKENESDKHNTCGNKSTTESHPSNATEIGKMGLHTFFQKGR